jgi:hypothetical protein
MTSATEYLLELLEEGGDDAMDFWAVVSEIAGTTITAFATEVPGWLRDAAVEAMTTALEKPYWTAIGESTLSDIAATLTRGIEDGLSTREIAALIQEDRGPDYAHYRAMNTARTEVGYMSNRGASASIERLEEETGLEMQKEWNSQLSTGTRPNHAAMEGQTSTGPEKLFAFQGQDGETYNIPEPGDPSLPAEDRCQCGCWMVSSFVGEEVDRSDLDAVREELLSTDSPTLIGMEASHKPHGAKYSPDQPRDDAGRFGEGGGSTSDSNEDTDAADTIQVDDAGRWSILPSRMKRVPKGKERASDAVLATVAKTAHAELTRIHEEFDLDAANTGEPLEISVSPITQGFVSSDTKGLNFGKSGITPIAFYDGDGKIVLAHADDNGKTKDYAESGPLTVGEFLVDRSGHGVVRHEFGHYVHDRMVDGEKSSEWDGIYNVVQKQPLDVRPGTEYDLDYSPVVSGYAVHNSNELFAESFCAYTHPDYKRGSLPAKVEKFLDNLIKKKDK